MPVQNCQRDGKPGFRWGEEGHCYTFNRGDPRSRARARGLAERQGRAIEASKRRQGEGGSS